MVKVRAQAGPFRGAFELSPIVVRSALHVDPVTAAVTVVSDPLPEIWHGIPLRTREVTVVIDRPGFMRNPTDCSPKQIAIGVESTEGTLAQVPQHFQASGCRALGFKPRLAISLRGGTRRGTNPSLRAVLRPRAGDANLKRTVLRLPRALFLDQDHLQNVCTRVQFAADACPKGSVYGKVVAYTPLLAEPLRGSVYLRSSTNTLPDLVFDLEGVVDVESSARIDSVNRGLRASFEAIPDVPLTKVVVRMAGGKRSLIEVSENLCRHTPRAAQGFEAHNGKRLKVRSTIEVTGCGNGAGKNR
jgi:hypothetical protein